MKMHRFLLITLLLGFAIACQSSNSAISSTQEDDIPLLPSINGHMLDQRHPITEVWYRRVITHRTPDGDPVAVIVPQFDAPFAHLLPDNLLLASDARQKRYLNRQLKEAIEKDARLRRKFNRKQQQMIRDNKIPIGYVWHHDAPIGKMQLVDKVIHDGTAHTGGRWIWGGGSNQRR
ncbi:HNH endonuclease [Entomospira culicis]|nr:HNH endonuclease [Entomospira culicis]WDI36685.1 HNH endonuclease [Entomospira culicis]